MRAVAAALAALTAALCVGATTAAAAPRHSTVSAAQFRRTMDRLWEEHVAWTRLAIVGFAAGLPDLPAAETRLLRNQTDIGNAIKPYYGAAAGTKLTALLKTHILQAVTVLQAAKAGDKAKLTKALDDWYANAHDIAAFLSSANPHSWPLQATSSMMKEHLRLTTKEAVDELGGHWSASAADYDAIENEILMMSQTLSDGIIKQFPGRFAV